MSTTEVFAPHPTPPAPFQTPHQVGDYAIQRRLGKGGMSEVHLAYDRRGRRVAVKHVPAGGDPNHRSRLRREARTTARVDHPTSVAILDVVEDEDGLWLVMEYVDGVTLAEEIAAGPLPCRRALDIAAQIADGLAASHDLGILHRDLKSENVMLPPDGRIRLLDFGLAKALWSDDDSQTLTRHGEVMGTCRAMSPEQARGWELDERSDLFSLGSLLYEMVTGVSPFKAKTPVATMNRVCTHEPPPPHLVESTVPRAVSQLVAQLHKKKAEERPADARDAATRIRSVRDQLDARGGAQVPVWGLSVAALVVVLVGAGLLLRQLEEPATPRALGAAAEAQSRSGPAPPAEGQLVELADVFRRCTDAACLEALRDDALRLLETEGQLTPDPQWAKNPPPVWLAEIAHLLAAVDFELAATDASVRWLELGREILIAHRALGRGSALPPALPGQLDEDLRRLRAWPDRNRITRPLGPLGVAEEVCADGGEPTRPCPPLLTFCRALERAALDGGLEELTALAADAQQRGWPRLELRARLEMARTSGDGAGRLADEATDRGVLRLADAARALDAEIEETPTP
ncbi:MAG: serine/threonine-protein kinase [Acidobacteriota bacterium]